MKFKHLHLNYMPGLSHTPFLLERSLAYIDSLFNTDYILSDRNRNFPYDVSFFICQ